MSEGTTHVDIARTRAGLTSLARAPVDEATVRSALAEVMDPELPMVSIVDLGMVGAVEVGRAIRVELLPTYVGCPALELIEAAVRERVRAAALGRPVEVVTTFDPPWTSERITPAGLAQLAIAGIAPPVAADVMRCPWCGSDAVTADSLFGPTQCRSLWYCRTCRQPFEAIKPI